MALPPLLKDLTPPLLLAAARRWAGRELSFYGRPGNWSEARTQSAGYEAAEILERVGEASRAVEAGRALFERDGVLFHEPDPPFAVLMALFRAAAFNGGSLDVIDFGGSLGSTYRLCRPYLAGLASVQWRVVEQAAFAERGQRDFTTAALSFASSLDALPAASPGIARLILAANVLQYIEDPLAALVSFASNGARHLVLDRLPMSEEVGDRLCIQRVPRHVAVASSYPMWIFGREPMLERLATDWHVVCEFDCPEGQRRTEDGLRFTFQGISLERHA